jgi:hypothetical protein
MQPYFFTITRHNDENEKNIAVGKRTPAILIVPLIKMNYRENLPGF